MNKRAYAIIVAGFFTVSIAYAIRYAYGMLLPEMLPDLGISKTQAGAIFAIYFVVYTVFTPVLGTLTDLYNYRLLLTVFSALLAAGALMMALASSFIQTGLIFAVAGLGHAACWAPVAALVQKWVPNNKRGTAMSVVTMGVGLGVFVWGGLLPIIVAASNWRSGWLVLGLCAVVVVALNFILVRNPPDHSPPQITAAQKLMYVGTLYKTLFKDHVFWRIALAYLFIGFNVLIPFTFLPVYAREVLHLDYASATRLIGLIALFGIAGQLILGTLSDVIGRINVLIICGLIMGSGCLGMVLFHSEWGLYAVVCFYGLGYGAIWPVYAAAASDFFSRSKTGSVVGLWTVFLGVGSIAAPILGGWLIDKTGYYSSTFLTGVVSGVVSSIILVTVLKFESKQRAK